MSLQAGAQDKVFSEEQLYPIIWLIGKINQEEKFL